MGFLKTILFFLFFYIIFKIIKSLFSLVAKPKRSPEPYVNSSRQSSNKINTSDIIDVDFEEIKTPEKNQSTDTNT